MGLTKLERRKRIKRRVRKHISGTTSIPRLSVFRSNKEFYAQLIDDESGNTLAAVSSLNNKEAAKGNKIERAALIGKALAEKASGAGIQEVKFDRNGYLFHGRIKAFADAAREAGLKF
ncbi:MAG: 50S ribosomal protein L18 [Crocinitomicaceae bacterium]|nr:50S ribosomal protein L18 [Crocinitomicaceae bacterium]|tara:strand:- start:10862 stop:11215 length:354 start_codon:yes stop_codon:yes gene_type:complete